MNRLRLPAVLLLLSLAGAAGGGGRGGLHYFEDFGKAGRPEGQGKIKWGYRLDMRPVSGWEEVVPGDGYAYLTIDSDLKNDKDKTKPFQSISFGPVGPGHRMEMRAKGAVVRGVAGFIFTYTEAGRLVDEIDIEVLPDDKAAPPKKHPTLPPDGWSDARFNSWGNANPRILPHKTVRKAIVDAGGKKVSHEDGRFHVYTIEWIHTPGGNGKRGRIEFRIDGVHQATITEPVPDDPSEVIMGFRQMPDWTGKLNWPGTHTMLIDWVRVTPWGGSDPVAKADAYEGSGTLRIGASKGVLANDKGEGLSAKLLSATEHGRLHLKRDGGFDYSPKPGFTGTDTFVYIAVAGGGKSESNAATVTLDVGKKWQAPRRVARIWWNPAGGEAILWAPEYVPVFCGYRGVLSRKEQR